MSEDGWNAAAVGNTVHDLEYRVVRDRILAKEPRIDGRDTVTVRPITIRTGVLPRVHGSALFTRGETQALVVATLGTGRDAQIIDALTGEYRQKAPSPIPSGSSPKSPNPTAPARWPPFAAPVLR